MLAEQCAVPGKHSFVVFCFSFEIRTNSHATALATKITDTFGFIENNVDTYYVCEMATPFVTDERKIDMEFRW